ncbi:MAG: adenylosuccinate lyase [Flavobacteriales bacterium]|nr:MAG: adenylosuccinate lyase [Flavobacteriales bacterium]
MDSLMAISPVDGRYQKHTHSLSQYFSEFALIKYRLHIEVEYFIFLSQQDLPEFPSISDAEVKKMRLLVSDFSANDAQSIKKIESVTNHDVKAVEYFLKEKIAGSPLEKYSEFIHFGLTSQDINNTAIPLSLKEYHEREGMPSLQTVIAHIEARAEEWKDIPLLARTHGQPASPTRLGKEMQVFVERLQQQLNLLKNIPFAAKFGGATGNLNAHSVAYPNYDWHEFARKFVEDILGLKRSHPTTQIEHYDMLAAYFDGMKRINTILIDFSRDIWSYISTDYFKQKIKEGEVGSSAMPHKVNPIDFENAEGNLGIANALLEHLSAKLPISRLQRDLTDSTVLRVIGVPLAHTMIANNALARGIDKLIVNEEAIRRDLTNNWAVVAEAVQTILRREGYPKPYEALKNLTRTHTSITAASMEEFVSTLQVSEDVKAEILRVTPFNYTGQ